MRRYSGGPAPPLHPPVEHPVRARPQRNTASTNHDVCVIVFRNSRNTYCFRLHRPETVDRQLSRAARSDFVFVVSVLDSAQCFSLHCSEPASWRESVPLSGAVSYLNVPRHIRIYSIMFKSRSSGFSPSVVQRQPEETGRGGSRSVATTSRRPTGACRREMAVPAPPSVARRWSPVPVRYQAESLRSHLVVSYPWETTRGKSSV